MTYSTQPYYIVKLKQRILNALDMKQKAFTESDMDTFRLRLKIANEELNEAMQLLTEIQKSMRKYMTDDEFVKTFR